MLPRRKSPVAASCSYSRSRWSSSSGSTGSAIGGSLSGCLIRNQANRDQRLLQAPTFVSHTHVSVSRRQEAGKVAVEGDARARRRWLAGDLLARRALFRRGWAGDLDGG